MPELAKTPPTLWLSDFLSQFAFTAFFYFIHLYIDDGILKNGGCTDIRSGFLKFKIWFFLGFPLNKK